ncbi:3'-5' exonuclease [uncultured Rikenella sp.]|uniref:3'-5' exonuclease n=1 Tax=uncultured Rikenella sp. TaxID=368003 RepID=UPI0025D6DFB6|nr:3'-5' exonuclease [uncultured Rikenella sp.]
MYQPTISPEELDTYPVGHFPGRILVVDSPETLLEAEQILAGATLLGYDTETRPSFEKGIRHNVSLIQIATADTALLFRVGLQPLSETVCRLLSSPDILKVGAALRDDLRGMRRVAEFRPAGFLDLQSLVSHWGIEELSVKKMAAIVLRMKVSKAQRLTNWEADRLTPAQQDYAALDAWVCREIYLRLRDDDPRLLERLQEQHLLQQPICPEPSAAASARERKRPRRHRGGRRHTSRRTPSTLHSSDSHDTTPAPPDPSTR